VKKLQNANLKLGYDKKDFKVIAAAVSNVTGKAYFQSSMVAGRENGGLDSCQDGAENPECDVEVEVLALSDYVKKNIPGDGPIHILQIDVEGYDANVLLGAGKEVLQKVEYLEFEYNWMGSWSNQHLYDIVEMLDEFDFTCYWAGRQKLWRITGCWQLYFDVHTWSNVACANRNRVPRLAEKMELIFQVLMEQEEMVGMDGRGINNPLVVATSSSTTVTTTDPLLQNFHEILNLDPAIIMTAKYLSKKTT
jgi:FkbM family methyltransferase